MKRERFIGIRLDDQLYERLARYAEREERSISTVGRLALAEYLKYRERLERYREDSDLCFEHAVPWEQCKACAPREVHVGLAT